MEHGLKPAVTPADELYEVAFARLSEGAHQDAIAQLKRAMALDPGQPKYPTALAKVYDMLGEREKARCLLDHALRLRRGRAA